MRDIEKELYDELTVSSDKNTDSTTFRDRLEAEFTDLWEKKEKLEGFLAADASKNIPVGHYELLEIQLKAMETYGRILRVRLECLLERK